MCNVDDRVFTNYKGSGGGGDTEKIITRNNKVWDIIIIKKYNLVIKVK